MVFRFRPGAVKARIDKLLEDTLKSVRYDPVAAPEMAKELAKTISRELNTFPRENPDKQTAGGPPAVGFPRYKHIVQVTLGELKDQGLILLSLSHIKYFVAKGCASHLVLYGILSWTALCRHGSRMSVCSVFVCACPQHQFLGIPVLCRDGFRYLSRIDSCINCPFARNHPKMSRKGKYRATTVRRSGSTTR